MNKPTDSDISQNGIFQLPLKAADTPLVTIVLPTCNGARFLQQSIDSCLAQTWRCLEVILVDDGSTCPETARIIDGQTDPRIHVVRLETNVGLPRALNAGFRQARGDLLTWTSDDNLYRPDAIETMARSLLDGSADFVYADATAIDEDGRERGALPVRDPDFLILGNCVGACFLYTRQVMDAIGEFNPDLRLVEDYDYWVRVSLRFPMRRLDRDLYLYRFHGETLTTRYGGERIESLVDHVRRCHFPRWRIDAEDGARALERGNRTRAARLLSVALLRRPWAWRYYRPAAIAILPKPLVRLLAAGRSVLRHFTGQGGARRA